MQGAPGGLSLQEIQPEFQVSRRTARRMRDAVLGLLPGVLNALIRFGADELAGPEGAIALLHLGESEVRLIGLKRGAEPPHAPPSKFSGRVSPACTPRLAGRSSGILMQVDRVSLCVLAPGSSARGTRS